MFSNNLEVKTVGTLILIGACPVYKGRTTFILQFQFFFTCCAYGSGRHNVKCYPYRDSIKY